MASQSNLKASSKNGLLQKVISYLAQFTGQDASAISANTQLADLGMDGFSIVDFGDRIDETSWLHGVQIPVDEWVACSKVSDIVALLQRYM